MPYDFLTGDHTPPFKLILFLSSKDVSDCLTLGNGFELWLWFRSVPPNGVVPSDLDPFIWFTLLYSSFLKRRDCLISNAILLSLSFSLWIWVLTINSPDKSNVFYDWMSLCFTEDLRGILEAQFAVKYFLFSSLAFFSKTPYILSILLLSSSLRLPLYRARNDWVPWFRISLGMLQASDLPLMGDRCLGAMGGRI